MYRLVITWFWFVCIYCFDIMRLRLERHLIVIVCSWIFNYLCNQCLSPLTLWVLIRLMARCTRHNMIFLIYIYIPICFTYSSLLLFCSRNNLFLVIYLTIQLRYCIYLFITVGFLLQFFVWVKTSICQEHWTDFNTLCWSEAIFNVYILFWYAALLESRFSTNASSAIIVCRPRLVFIAL